MTEIVRLEFPADTENVALARNVAATLAARADFTLDRVEDARLAVDEAVAQVIDGATAGPILCVFGLDASVLTVEVSGSGAALPDHDSFGWIVLRALVDEVDAATVGATLTISLRMAGAVPAHS